MHISLFDYNLPKELIAYYPSQKRDESNMLVYFKENDRILHTKFKNFPDFVSEEDVIIANNVKVIPARVFGRKETGGKVEIFLVRKIKDNLWEALIKASKPPKFNMRIFIDELNYCTIKDKIDNKYIVEFSKDFILEKYGKVPLPPYIKREPETLDITRYQTIFADEKRKGAVAAPTAGLHFTQEIINKLKERGIKIGFITLYVSYATFQPVRVENIEDHKMHYEDYEIPEETEELINSSIEKGKNILAIGTTVVRALEDNFLKFNKIKSGHFSTNLFIYPGFKFKVVKKLLTNFHLPKSTLLMLVCAFAGRKKILKCYQEAVKKRYRFFSYGDCMLIL